MEFSFRDSKTRSTPIRGFAPRERGQAVLEYILILVVVVAMIIGFVWVFGTAFKTWANNYFGNYLTCLLETGELPSTGSGGGGGGICNQYFEVFSLKNGRPIKGDAANKDGSQSGNKKNAGNGLNEGALSRRPVGGGGPGNSSNDDWAHSGRVNQNSSDSGDGSEEGKKTSGYASYSSGGGGYGYNSRGSGYGGRQLDGRLITGLKKEPEEKKGYPVPPSKFDDYGSQPKKVRLKPPRQPAAVAPDDSPMTFGNFLRILIIAAIIIALVVLIGGQLLQIGKEME